MSLNTIAKLAEVSVSTVSKAFSGSEEISVQTKEHIFKIARENGCFEKYSKNKYDHKVIGVVCPEINSDYYANILTVLNRHISARGDVMITAVSNFSVEREEELFTYFSAYGKVDGIIVIGLKAELNNSINVPLVVMFSEIKCSNADTIKCDIRSSVEKAIECFVANGHTRIGFAGEPLTRKKQEYYKEAMYKAGLIIRPSDIKISSRRFEAAGMEIMESWLEEKQSPTAILAAYDYIAIGLTRSIHSKGLRVPENFSIIGMDDISVIPYMETSMSSIRTNTEGACRACVDLIMKKIDNQYYSSRQDIVIATELIIRESVGKCPERR